jgi:hypothetical protein
MRTTTFQKETLDNFPGIFAGKNEKSGPVKKWKK